MVVVSCILAATSTSRIAFSISCSSCFYLLISSPSHPLSLSPNLSSSGATAVITASSLSSLFHLLYLPSTSICVPFGTSFTAVVNSGYWRYPLIDGLLLTDIVYLTYSWPIGLVYLFNYNRYYLTTLNVLLSLFDCNSSSLHNGKHKLAF